MNKHETLEALEHAHKLRKHADKLEKQAYEILDEKKEKRDEHEATAATHIHDSASLRAARKGQEHSKIAALHWQMSGYHDHAAAASTGDRARKHAAASAHHERAASGHYKKANDAMKPHFDAKSRNIIHTTTAEHVRKHFGDAIEDPRKFNAHGASRTIKRFNAK